MPHVVSHTPHALLQLFKKIVENVIAQTKDLELQITMQGTIGNLDSKYDKYYYAVSLTAENESILLDIPKPLIANRRIEAGDYVQVLGTLKPNYFNNQLSIRLVVSEINHADSPQNVERNRASHDLLTQLREVYAHRRSLPSELPRGISVIFPRSSKVQIDEDFLRPLGGSVTPIEQLSVNMQDADEIIHAIEQASGDVIALIRGGGELSQFAVFDDPKLIATLAMKDAFRIVGLGHSANNPLVHLVADHAASTPSAAGAYIAQQITASRIANHEKYLAKQEIEKAHQDNGQIKEQLKQAKTVHDSYRSLESQLRTNKKWLIRCMMFALFSTSLAGWFGYRLIQDARTSLPTDAKSVTEPTTTPTPAKKKSAHILK